MREINIAAQTPHVALALAFLLSACATMGLTRQFDSSDVAREWQKGWDRGAWGAPKDATVISVTDLSCKKASEHRHSLWCSFNLQYSSSESRSTISIDRWLLDPETLHHMQGLRP